MEVLQSRTDSFKAKRVQNPSKPSSSVNLKWPHPRRFNASPAVLAEAGFYFNPSYEDRDSVSCFYCDKQLSNWEADDDPFDIHWEKCRTTCCWAIVRCGLRGDMDSHRRFISTDKSRLPTSKNMEQARLGTFRAGNGWIHDQVEDHGANSRKMARAGFVYTPQHEGDDLATCLYCEVSLGGWDAEDDPMEEHSKRGNKSGQQCAFLAALELAATTTKPASRALSHSKPHSKSTQSKTKYKDIVLPTKTHDGELEDDSEGGVPPAASSAKRSTRGRSTSGSTRSVSGSSRSTKTATTVGKTPKKHTRSQSRGNLQDVNEGVEDAEEEREPESIPKKAQPTTTSAKASRSRSKSVSRQIPGAFTDDEDVEEVVEKKTVKNRSKAKEEAPIEVDAEAEEVQVLKKSTRGRPPKAKIEDDEAEEAPNIKKLTRGRPPKTRIVSTEEEPVEEDESEKPSRKPSRTKSKAKPEPEQEPEGGAEEVAKPASKTRPKTVASVTRKPSRTKPKPPVVEESEDVEENLPTTVVAKKTRAAFSTAHPKAPSTSKSKPKARLTEDEDIVADDAMEETDEMDVFVHPHPSPPPQPPSPIPVSSDEQKAKEREGLSEPEELSPLIIPKRSTKGKGKALVDEQPGKEDSQADDPSVAPKARVKQKNVSKVLSTTAVGKSSEEAPEPPRSKKPPPKTISSREIPAKIIMPTGDVEKMKVKKAANVRKGIKVVEISTDEEGEGDNTKDDVKYGKSSTGQRSETPKPKPDEKDPFVETTAQPTKPSSPRPPSPSRTTMKTPIKESEDVEMSGADEDLRVEDQLPQIHIDRAQEDPPKTPTQVRTNDHPSQSDSQRASAPPLVFPPLSKLPFTPIQNLSEAELDMTVEEWIRYQMEVEYDKFRRDGERELGRFKQRAEEVRGIIEGL